MPAARVTAATILEAEPHASISSGGSRRSHRMQALASMMAGGDRLLDFVSQRGGQFSHHAHAVHIREICLELAQSFALFLGAFALSNIRYRTYEDQTLRIFAGQAMSYGLNVFDGTVGHQQAMFGDIFAPLHRGAVKDLTVTHPVVRMSAVDHQLNGRLCRRLAFKYSIDPIGPVDFPGRSVPAEAPSVTQLLRRCQIHLAPAQRLLGLLAFGSFSGFAQRALHRWREP